MKDRIPTYPGRVKLVPVDGAADTYILTRADDATEPGTPISKKTLLTDEAAAALGLYMEDPTPNDAFLRLSENSKYYEGEGAPSSSISAKQGDTYFDKTDVRWHLCISSSAAGSEWKPIMFASVAMKTEIFTQSTDWMPPANMNFSRDTRILVFGGGGGGGGRLYGSGTYYGGGGGGGYMATYVGKLENKTYHITIGEGGKGTTNNSNASAGGTSSFDTLVSASGGARGEISSRGGNGGSGGGGASSSSTSPGGGNGSYGGGGGGGKYSSTTSKGGNGGTYGGGGGGPRGAGTGGTYGGDGGEPGTDTRSISGLDFTGEGLAGDGTYAGGGGYGGNGGTGGIDAGNNTNEITQGGGGGGGYGGNGGHGGAYAGGGGGGYGGNGGNGGRDSGGGGGGYGKSGNGGDGGSGSLGGDGGYAAGGGGYGGNGGNGIVILQYYVYEAE